MASDLSNGFRPGTLHIFYGHTKHNREGERKEQTNKNGFGSPPSATGGSLWHSCAALRAFVGYRRRVLVRNSNKVTRNADSSLDCPVLSTGLFCSLLLTVFFSLPLSSGSLCLLWDLPSLLHFRSRGRSHPQALCVGFVPKQKKGFTDRHPHKQTRMPPISSQSYFMFWGWGIVFIARLYFVFFNDIVWLHRFIWFQVFQSNTNNWHTIVLFQVLI